MSRFYTPIVHVKLTTVQRDATTAEEGMEIWNTTTLQQEYYNGSAWLANSGGGSLPDIKNGLMSFIPDSVPINSKLILLVAEVTIDFATNATNSVARAMTAPTSAMSLDVRKEVAGVDSSIGVIDFTANSKTGTFITVQTSIAVGDIIYITSPSDTFGSSDLFINFIGSSVYPEY